MGTRTVSQTINLSAPDQTSKYISADNSGLMVYDGRDGIQTPSNPSSTTNNVFIDENSLDIRKGTNVLATFGADGAQIGKNADGQSYMQLTSSGITLYRKYGSTSSPIATFGYGTVGNSAGNKTNGMYCSIGYRKSQSELINNYNSSSTYNAGDLCLYGGDIYVAQMDIPTPEEWNALKWKLNIGERSMSEGGSNTASGYCSHAEGTLNSAIGDMSHVEGHQTKALSSYGHAEGYATLSIGFASHAEGDQSQALKDYCHAEGYQCKAHAYGAHAQNTGAVASSKSQTALGEYNIKDSSGSAISRGNYAVIIGNGTADNARSNALTVDWDGNITRGDGASYTAVQITRWS